MKKTPKDIEPVRLNRFLAMIGVGSRRACDDIIAAGRVEVDGRRVREPGERVVPGVSRVSVENTPLQDPPRPLVLLLNKPTGYVSTADDPMGRPTVIDLCKRYARRRRLFPVGRLDINTTGAILLTNDGMLCYRLTHPRFEIPRVYNVRVRGHVDDRKIRGLRKLASPSRHGKTAQAGVDLVRNLGKESILRITLHEGRNRQVRRMCETVGLYVVQLRRLKFGPISIRKLPMGAARPLEPKEIASLRRLTS